MRLTLRTLLAYLENVLDEQDREDLRRQVESSENAAELIHKMRDVAQRLRLGAPEVLGTTAVDDPNTMAEYLDSTLPPENVADFERVCLESETMLAEAVACQHAIAMVLGQPAQVDPDTRRRLHELPDMLADLEQARAEEARATEARQQESAAADGDQTDDAPAEQSDGPHAPDYLRSKEPTPWLAWAMAVAAVALLGLTVYVISNTPDETTIADAGQTSSGADSSQSDGDADASEQETEHAESDPAQPSHEESAETDQATSETDTPTTGEAVADELPEEVGETDEVTDEGPAPEMTDPGRTEPVDNDSSELGEPVTEPDAPTGDEQDSMVEPVEESPPTTDDSDTPEPNAEADDAPARDASQNDEPFLAGEVGTVDESLLMIEREPQVWARVGSGEELGSAAKLLSLPTYRSAVRLSDGLRLELVGLAQVELSESTTNPGAPRIELDHGRVLIVNDQQDSAQEVEVAVGGAVGHATIGAGASLGVAAERPYTPGLDVFNQSPPMNVRAYAPKGGVTWVADADRYEFGRSRQWGLTDAGDLTDLRDYTGDSGWIEGVRLGPWDDQASPLLPRDVPVGEEAWPQLIEVLESNPFKEVRALASRCSAAVGYPDPLVESLADPAQTAVWRDNLRELRAVASRGTIEASLVRRVLIEQHGERSGSDLFLMLRGYSPAQIGRTPDEVQRGVLPQLLDWLESESLAVRVLANANLEEITGRSELFDPIDNPVQRRQALRRLRKQLRDNELYVAAP